MKLGSKKGFTLIELLVVIAIIGILAVALLPTILGAPAKGRDAARKSNLSAIMTSIETWNVDGKGFSLSNSGTPSVPQAGVVCIGAGAAGGNKKPDAAFVTKYLQGGVQTGDPQGASATAVSVCARGDYYYCQLSGAGNQNYVLASIMETPEAANANNGTTWPTAANCGGATPTALAPTLTKPTGTGTDINPYYFVLIR